MSDTPQKTDFQNPADIAREAFRRLAIRRIAPTPEAYREIYNEIAGSLNQPSAEMVLTNFAASLSTAPNGIAEFASRLTRALETRDWQTCSQHLSQLVDKHLRQVDTVVNAKPLLDQVPAPSAAINSPLVDSPEMVEKKPSADMQLIERTGAQPASTNNNRVQEIYTGPIIQESEQVSMLRGLLVRTLTLALGSLLQKAPALAEESEAIAAMAKNARTDREFADVSTRLKQLCFKIELKSADMAEEHELLLRLFKLLLENVGELLEDDSWLSGQIAGVQEILSGPLSHNALHDATRSLKEVIYKQGMLKHSLTEAKVTVKNMMLTFIDRLGAVATSTEDYHKKIDAYSQKITHAKDIVELNSILDDVMQETRLAQTEALRSRDDMISARQNVQEAEARIHELESKLKQMSELMREDQLTGSLNRRGLEDVLEREIARSERRKSPLCIAMLDLDDFKRLNDTYGHIAGDGVLVHLVRVVKDTLRTMDVIARFGGEEFLIVLPDTSLENATQTIIRLQRELTKRIFMHNNQHLLITFSAGVALRGSDEDPTQMIKRADEALYKAKQAGKNRVIVAD